MYLLVRVRTHTGTSCAVLCWTARAMCLLARVRTRTGTSCAVLRLDSTGNIPSCPWSYSYWCPHGQCTYLPVFVLVLVPLVYLLARGRTRLSTSCAVLRLDSTGYVPMCPCLYPCTMFVQCFARAMYLLARGRTRTGVRTGNVPTCPWSYSYWYLLCSASLGQHGLCTYVPVLVSFYSVLLWVIRAKYVPSCLDSRAVLVALLLLTWTVCW